MYKYILLLIVLILAPLSGLGCGCGCEVSDGMVYYGCEGDLIPCTASEHIGSPTLYWSDAYITHLHGTVGFDPYMKIRQVPIEDVRANPAAIPAHHLRSGYTGYLFTKSDEQLIIETPVPIDWDASSDMYFMLDCILLYDESINDILDWQSSTKSVEQYENIDTTGIQVALVNWDIGVHITAGTFHRVPITLDYDNGVCPIEPYDCMSITINRPSIDYQGYVGDIILVGVYLYYQCDKLGPAP